LRARGRESIAAAAAELLEVNPGFPVGKFVKTLPFKAPQRKEWVRDLLLKGGRPEG
jgi:hypothetical protein